MTLARSAPIAADPARDPARRLRLAAEFVALFVGLPLALAFLLPPSALWPVIFSATGLSVALLAITPGFAWSELLEGPVIGSRRLLAGVAVVTAAVAFGAVWLLRPGALLTLPLHRTELWLAILLLYPVLSALPQELMFRVLFFRRYGALFPDRRAAIAVDAALFALAHLFLWNSIALAMTAAGGAIFAHAYLNHGRGRALWSATLLHTATGWILFTSGIGTFFYHGAVAP